MKLVALTMLSAVLAAGSAQAQFFPGPMGPRPVTPPLYGFYNPGVPSAVPWGNNNFTGDYRSEQVKARLKHVINRSFVIVWNPVLNDTAMSKPGNVIEINPNAFFRLSRAAQDFVLLHEAGHHMLHHDLAYFPQYSEMQADEYAALKMHSRLQYDNDEIIQAAAELMNNPGDATHPPGMVRIRNVRQKLAAIEK